MNRIVMPVIMLAMFAALATSAIAQKFDRIVTNGDLTPGKEFHLLLIHDGGQYSQHIAAMLVQPRAHMVDWVRSSNVRVMQVNESQVMENHADLMQKHQGQMPILAMIQQTEDDGRGATWCSAAGNQIPSTESGLASWLGTYYQATVTAASKANYVYPRDLQPKNAEYSGGSYFMPRSGGSAPPPYQPSGGRRPFINPQVDVAVPDTLNTAVGLNPDTIWAGVGAAVVAIVCCLILSHGRVQSANIHANAITHEPGKLKDDGDD